MAKRMVMSHRACLIRLDGQQGLPETDGGYISVLQFDGLGSKSVGACGAWAIQHVTKRGINKGLVNPPGWTICLPHPTHPTDHCYLHSPIGSHAHLSYLKVKLPHSHTISDTTATPPPWLLALRTSCLILLCCSHHMDLIIWFKNV